MLANNLYKLQQIAFQLALAYLIEDYFNTNFQIFPHFTRKAIAIK